jgi:hypothetical protein
MIKIKKLKIALSFASPEKENYYIYIYAVITWEIFYKRPSNYYCGRRRPELAEQDDSCPNGARDSERERRH